MSIYKRVNWFNIFKIGFQSWKTVYSWEFRKFSRNLEQFLEKFRYFDEVYSPKNLSRCEKELKAIAADSFELFCVKKTSRQNLNRFFSVSPVSDSSFSASLSGNLVDFELSNEQFSLHLRLSHRFSSSASSEPKEALEGRQSIIFFPWLDMRNWRKQQENTLS